MASSNSIKRAQTVKQCELCEEKNSKWRCMECNMCLCEQCKTLHIKIPAAAHHQIVTIGTPLKDIERKIFTDNIPCQEHLKEKTILYCRSCKCLICQHCVSSNHKMHNFDTIKSALDEKIENLRAIQTKIGDNIKCCESKTSEVENTRSKFNTIFDETLTKIKLKEDELVQEIRKYSKLLQENVEKGRTWINNTLIKSERDVNNKKKIFEDSKEELDAILMSCHGSDIFKANMMVEDIKFDPIPKQAENFYPGTTSIKQIQEMFGSLQKLSFPMTHDLPEMKFEVKSTFSTDLPFIEQVEPVDETSAWISCFEKNILRKINIKDNNIKTLNEVSFNVNAMTTFPNGDLLFSVHNESTLRLLKHSGEITSFLSVAPLLPVGINITKDNVFVGIKEQGNSFTPTDQSQRAVIVYGMDGKQKHEYQYDKEGQMLFIIPYKIKINTYQDILVVDRTSSSTGKVVALNTDGVLKWIYEGHSKINAGKKFDPREIVITSMDCIIISDYQSSALHVLSEKGEVLTYKHMEIDRPPMGLGIDNKGKLWLGYHDKDDENAAKLDIVEL